MSKLIAVWGTPQSGKTTFTVKLANALNLGGKGKSIHSAIAVFPDITTPVVPTVFPNKKDEELYSLGSVLQKPDLTRNLVVSNTIFVKDRSNLGFLGYTAKENRYSYAEYTREKAEAFLDCVMSIAEYVVVDCSSDPEDNILTETVLEKADIVIRLLSPDLKGISNYLSQTPIFIRMGYMKENCVQLISVTSPEFQYGAADTISYFGKFEQIIPYSQTLKEQYVSGNLTEVTKDKKYAAVLEAVRQKVVK